MTSFPRRCGDARPLVLPGLRGPIRWAGGSARDRPYTPAMRRWVCIIALLAGFSADDYVWSARPRHPVPIERRLDLEPPLAPVTLLRPTSAWWGRP